ncbi:phage portal protein [Chromobacterium violaceum]|uniref:phage portal protein n=1 Tax=Chromobacterium violaceum TaxID=536 RepID=UPI00069D3D34|nr:phage portal protein [Chromobacterium violaceum]
MTAGQKVPIEPGLIARVTGAIKSVFSGAAYMGPAEPMAPVVSDPVAAGTEGRQFDYPTGYNLVSRPRSTELTTFEKLRALADGCDILRAAIETRKDAIDDFRFAVKPRDGKSKPDKRCKQIEDFLRFPDGEHDFSTWARAIVEDMLVLDAASIYPWKTNGGELYRLELIDGATVKRLIDATGRTPPAPSPAYQQVIKGVVVANYAADELVYMPRNVRTNKIYGHSVVEQILLTVNMAIRRAIHQLQFYTEGSTPDLVFSLPPEWTIEQVRAFDKHWNDTLSGDTAARRRTKFVPGGTQPFNVKEGALQDQFDEWIARVVCYALNVPNHWALKQQTRAGQQTEQASADMRGDEITKAFLKALLDRIIAQHFKAPDLVLEWDAQEEIDPEARAKVQDIKVRNGTLAINEARAEDNREPVDGGDVPMFATATGFVPIIKAAEDEDNPNDEPDPNADPPARKLAKFAEPAQVDAGDVGSVTPVKPTDRHELELAALLLAFLQDWWKRQVLVINLSSAEAALASLDLAAFAGLSTSLESALSGVTNRAITAGASQARATAAQTASAAQAAATALRRRVDGLLSPAGDVSIARATANMLKSIIEDAIQRGISADQIDPGYAVSPERAATIAGNEVMEAQGAAKLSLFGASPLVAYKRWNAYPGCCSACLSVAGESVPLDEPFSNGAMRSPLHVGCRCDIEPELIDSETGEIT